jgi:hypothetical protein
MTDPIRIDNISSFFELSNYEYRVFDMSRTVRSISNEEFKKIETQKALFPTPFQQHAWLGIIFWHPESVTEPAIWFLKFPIDELGFLKLEARDSFIQEMLEQVGNKIKAADTADETADNGDSSKAKTKTEHESMFAFKPQQDKMAIFNALATRALDQKPSKFYEHAHDYFEGTPGFDQWSFMGFQGLADIAANLDLDDNMHYVAAAIPQMPEQPLILFTQLLEHVEPDGALSKTLLARLNQELTSESANITVIASLARGLSSSPLTEECTKKLLNRSISTDIEVLAVIASRLWSSLKDKNILKDYLEALAQQEQQSFDVILMELLPIPDMRGYLLEGLKNPKRSKELAQRIGGFMKRFQ